MGYFDDLLGTITDSEAKLALEGVIAKAPQVKEWVVSPEDRAKEKAAIDQLASWRQTYWDDQHNMTQKEWRQVQALNLLQTQLDEAQAAKGTGDDMDLAELDSHLGKFMADKKLVNQDSFTSTLADKEKEFNTIIGNMSRTAARLPYLNAKHDKEFGSMFDPDEFLNAAMKANETDLDKYYNAFTAEKREANRVEKETKAIEAAREEGRREALQGVSMGEKGVMPTLDGPPDLGHFQKKVMRINEGEGEKKDSVPADAELGRGTIARFAALAGDKREMVERSGA